MPHSIQSVMLRLDPYLDDFDKITREAMEKYQGYGRIVGDKFVSDVLMEHSKRTAANCIYDHMIWAWELHVAGLSEIRYLEIRGLKLWLIGDEPHTVIRWKKMDEEGRHSRYSTPQAEDFDRQLPLEGLTAHHPTRIVVGYWPDPAGTSVTRTQIARPMGTNIDWCAAVVFKEKRVAGAGKWVDVGQQQRLAVRLP